MTSAAVPRRELGPSHVGLVVAVLSAVLQLAPVLGRGYVLVRDMVFVPRPPLTDRLLGVTGVPRAVPSDLVTALLTRVLPGVVVEDLVLVAIIGFAGWGAARLVPTRSRAAAAAAALLFSWNPYLTERLRQGQWAVLVGYAALPWAVHAAVACRAGVPRAAARLLVALGLGAVGGAAAELLVALAVLPVLLWPGGAGSWRSRTVTGVGGVALMALPWLVPSLTRAGGYPPDRVGATLFAARPDTPLGALGSLAGLGGIWNAQVVPPGRDTALVGAASLLLTVAALAAAWWTRQRWPAGTWRGLVTAGALSFAVSAWGAVPGLRVLLAKLLAAVPAVGLLRDGQRWLAPFALLVAVGFGLAVELALVRLRPALVLVVAPALLLPAAAWGSDGALAAVDWPPGWQQVAAADARLPAGPVLVVPWSAVRVFPWNGGRALADPADRWLSSRTVGDDSLDVGGVSTSLEDPAARRIAPAVSGRGSLVDRLRASGYAGVLVERDQPGAGAVAGRLSSLPAVTTTADLQLLRVAAGGTPRRLPHAPLPPAVAADLVALLAWCVAVSVAVIHPGGRRETCIVSRTGRHPPSAGMEETS